MSGREKSRRGEYSRVSGREKSRRGEEPGACEGDLDKEARTLRRTAVERGAVDRAVEDGDLTGG